MILLFMIFESGKTTSQYKFFMGPIDEGLVDIASADPSHSGDKNLIQFIRYGRFKKKKGIPKKSLTAEPYDMRSETLTCGSKGRNSPTYSDRGEQATCRGDTRFKGIENNFMGHPIAPI